MSKQHKNQGRPRFPHSAQRWLGVASEQERKAHRLAPGCSETKGHPEQVSPRVKADPER